MPVMAAQREYAEAGSLMAYGASLPEMYRRAATYVDISKYVGRVNYSRGLVGALLSRAA